MLNNVGATLAVAQKKRAGARPAPTVGENNCKGGRNIGSTIKR